MKVLAVRLVPKKVRRALDTLELGLRMVGSCSVGARNQNPALCKINKCS